jgi:hypothetical protein
MLVTCFITFCLEMWNVIEKCDFKFFFLQKVFLWIRSRDHVWSFHRLCFDCSTWISSRWRTKFNSIFRNDRILTKRLIKFDESDSSNLTKAIHQIWQTTFRQIWWVVSHQIWWAIFHQIWRMIFHQTWRMIFHQTWRIIFH